MPQKSTPADHFWAFFSPSKFDTQRSRLSFVRDRRQLTITADIFAINTRHLYIFAIFFCLFRLELELRRVLPSTTLMTNWGSNGWRNVGERVRLKFFVDCVGVCWWLFDICSENWARSARAEITRERITSFASKSSKYSSIFINLLLLLSDLFAFIEIVLKEIRLMTRLWCRQSKLLVCYGAFIRESLAEMDPLEAWKVFDVPQDITELWALLSGDWRCVDVLRYPFGDLFLVEFHPAFGEVHRVLFAGAFVF